MADLPASRHADVAQLVERLLGKEEVPGPIPGVGSRHGRRGTPFPPKADKVQGEVDSEFFMF